MQKLSTLLVTSALVGVMSVSAFVPAATAQQSGGQPAIEQADSRGGDHRGMRGGRDDRGGMRGMQGGLLHLVCSDEAAERLETGMSRLAERLELTEEQSALFETFRTDALSAQTSFADTCMMPDADSAETADLVDRLRQRQANGTAMITAIDDVLPSLEAFYDSLTDEQKDQLKPGPRGGKGPHGDRDDRGERGKRGERHGPHGDRDDDDRAALTPEFTPDLGVTPELSPEGNVIVTPGAFSPAIIG